MSKLSIDIETFIEVTDDGLLTTEVYCGDTDNPVNGDSYTITDIIEKTVEYYKKPNGGYSHTEDLRNITKQLRSDLLSAINIINNIEYQLDNPYTDTQMDIFEDIEDINPVPTDQFFRTLSNIQYNAKSDPADQKQSTKDILKSFGFDVDCKDYSVCRDCSIVFDAINNNLTINWKD